MLTLYKKFITIDQLLMVGVRITKVCFFKILSELVSARKIDFRGTNFL